MSDYKELGLDGTTTQGARYSTRGLDPQAPNPVTPVKAPRRAKRTADEMLGVESSYPIRIYLM
jgi:hypothetical protein